MSGSDLLFRATSYGNLVEVGLASGAELAVIAGVVEPASARDTLETWSLVAIHHLADRRTEVHALGWRRHLDNTWITSRLVSFDPDTKAVGTQSGHTYRLGTEDVPGLSPELRDHLAYALHTWGFTDVRP